MKKLFILLALPFMALAQLPVSWSATTGDVSLSGAGTTATIQQPASGQQQVLIDKIIVYCSVACSVTQTANGTAATATAGTITPVLPSPLNSQVTATFWTASNVGNGTIQGGIVHIAAGATQIFCLSPVCGQIGQIQLPTSGTSSNYSVIVSSITGTANITFYGRSL